jgi:hypothetical protein
MRAYGDDGLAPGPSGQWFLTCRVSKGWKPRLPRTPTSPEHPGTAVSWDGEIFEVLSTGPGPDGGSEYTLAPWEDRHVIRGLERYDEPSERNRSAERRRREAALWKRRSSFVLAPILGHLPGAVQMRMEAEFGAPARMLTIASALPLLVLGALSLLDFLLASFGGGAALGGWPTLPLPLGLYLFLESAVRLGIAFAREEPAGSALGIAAYHAWRAVRRSRP